MKTGIGLVLKEARERQGLNYTQVYQMTRLRSWVLEALENEDWERLPSKVFVTGFIRSYAHALGLDGEAVVGPYQDVARTVTVLPEPHQKRGGALRKAFAFLLFVLLAAALVYYFSIRDIRPAWVPSKTAHDGNAQKRAAIKERLVKVPEGSGALPTGRKDPGQDQGKTPLDAAGPPARETSRAETGGNRSSDLKPTAAASESNADRKPEMVLQAYVKELTWLSISVDGESPREYVFQPGSRPTWTGRQGFDLLIGNAGGIDFEFQGKKIEDLGALWQVVRLKLP